jgi:hypothetical protein
MESPELPPSAEAPEAPEAPACRHEYVRIYQRKLKGLERRLCATKAWLPVGFKMADFSHLSEGSYCFCSKCRARLYPKRSQAEKAQARIALAASKAEKAGLLAMEEEALYAAESDAEAEDAADDGGSSGLSIHVEELEIESVSLEDLEEGAVSLPEEKDCSMPADE